jgi:hypothetical protein
MPATHIASRFTSKLSANAGSTKTTKGNNSMNQKMQVIGAAFALAITLTLGTVTTHAAGIPVSALDVSQASVGQIPIVIANSVSSPPYSVAWQYEPSATFTNFPLGGIFTNSFVQPMSISGVGSNLCLIVNPSGGVPVTVVASTGQAQYGTVIGSVPPGGSFAFTNAPASGVGAGSAVYSLTGTNTCTLKP